MRTTPVNTDAAGYRHEGHALGHHHSYLLPTVDRLLGPPDGRTVFEIGFGNGSVAHHLTRNGFSVVGVEPSADGLMQARAHYPSLKALHEGSAYDDLAARFGTFPIVLCLEVVEHLYAPRKFATAAYNLLMPGGTLIVSTPYHGYLKNLAIVLAGGFDRHHDPLWDHGHIKFWSKETLGRLLREAGFAGIAFHRVGRIPPLAKSMIAVARKPDRQ